MQHFFILPLFIFSHSRKPNKKHHPNRTTILSSPQLSLSLFLLLFVVLSARCRTHHPTHTHAVTLSRNCQNFPISRALVGSLSLALLVRGICLLIFRPVCSHKSVAAGALQRNFLPFIAQHIFFGIFSFAFERFFFSFFYAY